MAFEYSKKFQSELNNLLSKRESSPYHSLYIQAHLGGENSREVVFEKFLIPEIKYHCPNLKNKSILDLGAGTGSTTLVLAKHFGHIDAFDTDQKALVLCKLRLKENGFGEKVTTLKTTDLGSINQKYDFILMNAVVEHIPLSEKDLRRKVIRQAFSLLKPGGYLYINDTPNRIFPLDRHTTNKWLIPWTRPGNRWAFSQAKKMGLYSQNENKSIKLEEDGAWGATYLELRNYFKGLNYKVLNLEKRHDRFLAYSSRSSKKRQCFETLLYYTFVKTFRLPLTTFWPSINNLVIQKIID